VHGVGGEPALLARGVSAGYGSRRVLQDVSFSLDPGEVVVLVGPNGAGKSTLLRCLLGLQPRTAGEVVVHGQHCTGVGHRVRCAFVPQRQDVDLSFPITVSQVVLQGRRPFRRAWRRPGVADHQAALRALSRVGLEGTGDARLDELSGGQAQRIFIARALAQEADVLLLDEPLTGVDAAMTESLCDLLDGLSTEGAAVLLTSHDLGLVRRRFSRCMTLNGRLAGDGAPADVLGAQGMERMFVAGLS